MELARMLHIQPGVTALIGAGGKTTLLYALGRELSENARVILTTSTHILRPSQVPCLLEPGCAELDAALARHRCVCVGSACEDRLGAPGLPMRTLAGLADYVIVEADGARMRPIKAHAAHEPVIPPESGQTILLLGAKGLGKPVREAVHRPERLCALLGAEMDEPVTPELAAELLVREALHGRVVINQVESRSERQAARELASRLGCPVAAGALQREELECWY